MCTYPMSSVFSLDTKNWSDFAEKKYDGIVDNVSKDILILISALDAKLSK